MSFINDKTTFLFIDDFNGEVCVHHTSFSTNYHAGKKKQNKYVFQYKMAYFCIDASALKWPPFALPAESMASQYSVTSDSASGFAVRFLFFCP